MPERTPQFPHGVSRGSLHSNVVIVQASGYVHWSLHMREPLPASVLQGVSVPGMHAPPPRHISSYVTRPVAGSHVPSCMPVPQKPQGLISGSVHSYRHVLHSQFSPQL
jgi:hypothetical protein